MVADLACPLPDIIIAELLSSPSSDRDLRDATFEPGQRRAAAPSSLLNSLMGRPILVGMPSEDRNKKIFRNTLARVLDLIPGLSLMRGAVEDTASEKERRAAETFLETVRPYVDQGNFAAVSLYVGQRADDPGLHTLVQEQLRDIQSVDNELGKSCLVLLAVDRMQTPKVPDRLYRQLAKVLAESDVPTLRVMREMADAIHVLSSQFIALMAGTLDDGPVSYMKAPGMDAVFLSREVDPLRFEAIIDFLVSHRMANRWEGMGSAHNKAAGIQDVSMQHLGRLDSHHQPPWEALRKYLEPLSRD
ncbi:hypothetical protein [Nannocystis bainbridge]|uniref:Uncharacterized protein n=1 Tax=Nannocystis bainbridge TaxID=2995303 RepID=A0ABT5DU39_9BACT|nr:hypothetical protein [Nannocystis bainbridge]MDC0716238.1 hypothetical protein [Nannocystis bainbridge]